MELSVQNYLDSVSNPNTKKEYRHGINKFCEWYGKTAEQILELRKNDLTQHPEEGLIEWRNRATRFEKEIEKFPWKYQHRKNTDLRNKTTFQIL
jgi:hypothetical protein